MVTYMTDRRIETAALDFVLEGMDAAGNSSVSEVLEFNLLTKLDAPGLSVVTPVRILPDRTVLLDVGDSSVLPLGSKMVLEANPNYRAEYFPAAPEGADAEARDTAARLSGSLCTRPNRNTATITSINGNCIAGPASETSVPHHFDRRRSRSIYTAPPGSPIPPSSINTTGIKTLVTGCV